MRRAFTLVELLVVISIIALLMSLTLPALSGSRRQAKATVGFANMRSLGQVLAIYVNENHDTFLCPFRKDWGDSGPHAGTAWTMAPSFTDPTLRWDFADPVDPCAHTEAFGNVWYSYLAEYRAGHRADPEQLSPADGALLAWFQDAKSDPSYGDSTLLPTSFLYPPVFWSKPERFGPCKEVMTAEFIRATPLAAVTYPSAKVMVFERLDFATAREPLDYILSRARSHAHIFLVDGSADSVAIADLSDAWDRALLPAPPQECCNPIGDGPPFWSTLHGSAGRDLPR
jgi:prepilin-type N-terminal cleavage/methylation domain-containing protein